MEPQNVKVLLVGDSKVGKTCLLDRYKNGRFPGDDRSQVSWQYDNEKITYLNKPINLTIWNTRGSEDYDHIRALSYPLSNVILVCFSVVDRKSFANVTERWVPETRHFCPTAPFILVGTKIDLRTDQQTLERLAERKITPISRAEGMKLAEQIGAYTYVENSALTNDNVEEAFDIASEAVLNPGGRCITKPAKPPKPMEPKVNAEKLLLKEAMQKLIGKKEFSDVTFVLQDQREVPAHKIILASSMPVLYKALVKNKGDLPPCFKLRETVAKTNMTALTIDVNLEPAVFDCVLYSIYTGYPAHARDFNEKVVQKAFDFFVVYPRFSLEERCKVMAELALNANPPFADVCFEVNGKRRVFAHKVLLASTSQYFDAIFKSGMKESQMEVIPLEDVDESDLSVLKEFLYSGSTNSLNTKNVANIIGLANQYNMDELLTHCEVTCKENIDSFDLYELYQLAIAHNCAQLRAYVIWQMKIQYDDIKDEGWFKNELPTDIRGQVECYQWPGQAYYNTLKTWEQAQKKKSGKDCVMM